MERRYRFGSARAILNRAGDVVGISNVFGGDWAGAVAAAARSQGFEPIGPLRVWMR